MLLVFLMLMMRRHELDGGNLNQYRRHRRKICGAVWLEGSPKV